VGDTCPVYNVSWTQVCGGETGDACYGLSFIGKVNTLLGTTKFRLPTEAEWEQAARGGTQPLFSFWDDPSCSITECSPWTVFAQYMWWCGNATAMSHPVGQKLANPFGLYDMDGNVWEWAADCMGSYPADPVVDPKGPPWNPVRGRAVRGGGHYSEYSYPRLCRSATRGLDFGGDPGIGLRLARTP
jgi:formylglycine-generating enzyme required for sulfatase activity